VIFLLGRAPPLYPTPLDAYGTSPSPYWNPKYATGHGTSQCGGLREQNSCQCEACFTR